MLQTTRTMKRIVTVFYLAVVTIIFVACSKDPQLQNLNKKSLPQTTCDSAEDTVLAELNVSVISKVAANTFKVETNNIGLSDFEVKVIDYDSTLVVLNPSQAGGDSVYLYVETKDNTMLYMYANQGKYISGNLDKTVTLNTVNPNFNAVSLNNLDNGNYEKRSYLYFVALEIKAAVLSKKPIVLPPNYQKPAHIARCAGKSVTYVMNSLEAAMTLRCKGAYTLKSLNVTDVFGSGSYAGSASFNCGGTSNSQ
jgi:hypothetical protein